MDTFITEINTLADRYKRNRKLSKKDQNQALEIMSLLLSNFDRLDQGIDFLFCLPAITVTEAFWLVWKDSNIETRQLLVEKLTSHKDTGSKAGITRELLIIKKLMAASDEFAFRLLSDWCLRSTKDARKIPNKSNAELFSKEIMKENLLLNMDINGRVTPRDMSAITLMVLYDLFSDTSVPNHPELAVFYFEWIKSANITVSFPPATGKQLNEMIKGWPDEILCKVSELNGFKVVMKNNNLHSSVRIPDDTGSQKTGQVIKTSTTTDAISGETPKAKSSEIFDVNGTLDSIKQYIKGIEGQLAKYRLELSQAQKNYEHEKNHRISVQSRLMETEELLKISNGSMENLRSELYQAQEKIKRLESELDNTRVSHREKVESLLDMSEHEVNYAVKEFQNVLARDLQLEYTDFMAVVNEDITPDLAENFKAQLLSIFNILRGKGLKL